MIDPRGLIGSISGSTHALWTRTQLRAPRIVRHAVLPRLHDLKEVIRLAANPMLPVTKLSGSRAGNPLTVTFINVRFLGPYLKSIIFEDKPKETPLGTIPFWRYRDIAGLDSGDLVFAEASRHLILRLARFGGVVLPQGIRHILGVTGKWEEIRSRFHKSIRYREKQWMERFRYEFEVSHEEDDLKEFYYSMYLPLMNNRHGELSSPESLAEACEFLKTGCLLKVMRDDKWVAGSVCQIQDSEVIGRLNGVRDGDAQLVNEGAIFMTVLGSARWANENGFEDINFLSTEPFINDGKFSHKSQWGTRLVLPDEFRRRIWLSVRRYTPAVESFLKENPFIATDARDNLYSVVFVDRAKAEDSDTLAKKYTFPGVKAAVIRPTEAPAVPETRSLHRQARNAVSNSLGNRAADKTNLISVLLPDGDSQFAVFVMHCLGRRPDVRVHLMSKDRFAAARLSRYCRSFTQIPEGTSDDGQLELVERTVRKHRVNVVLPIDTDWISFAIDHKQEISAFAAIAPIPNRETFEIANDKWLTAKFLEENQIPLPPTHLVTFDDTFKRKLEDVRFPVLLKPIVSRGGEGISRFDSASELFACLETMPPDTRSGKYIVQTLLPGDTVAVDVLALDGRVLATTMHTGMILDREEFSSPGAFRYFRNPDFERTIERLVSCLDWSGCGCLDTLYDPTDNTLKIIEINSRFWGSVRGGLVVGVNYPCLCCLAALGIPFDPPSVGSGQYCHSVTALRELANGITGKKRQQRFRFRETGLQFFVQDPFAEGLRTFRREQSGRSKNNVVEATC